MYTRAKKIGRKVMAGGENRMMQPAAPRCGQVAQVDRFVADVVEKDTIHIHQRSLAVQTVMARYYQMWHLLWFVYHHSAHRQPHRAVRGVAAGTTCRDGSHRCCHRRLLQRRRDRLRWFVTIGTSARDNCYERSFQ